jgi:hypothetical protein
MLVAFTGHFQHCNHQYCLSPSYKSHATFERDLQQERKVLSTKHKNKKKVDKRKTKAEEKKCHRNQKKLKL